MLLKEVRSAGLIVAYVGLFFLFNVNSMGASAHWLGRGQIVSLVGLMAAIFVLCGSCLLW